MPMPHPGAPVSARLRSLRVVGFKSFAERTLVDFGPGISAIVGPNGSGKSNLADALRWALGEQGRSLRTRRAEDVIFAGSSSRRAIGMADVTLVIDNQDGLLPVDYGEVELGRRLFRSGENEYLLNRQRVRLRDLVDLLDEANLADNAFLFIGQGMVDQALALRPEERRPLFEEAAGIRRHERRRRRAEAELSEAGANLDRVRDLLAELRPQARRLAAQAEQQEARQSAGRDLAAALVGSARARLGAMQGATSTERRHLREARSAADAALGELRSAEDAAASISRALAERSEAERAARDELDRARERTMELRLAEARASADLTGLERDRARLDVERSAAIARAEEARRQLAEPPRGSDASLLHALEEARAEEADAVAAWNAFQRSAADAGARGEANRREQERHSMALARAALRVADAEAGQDAQGFRAESAASQARITAAAQAAASAAAASALETETGAESALETARHDDDRAVTALADARARATDLAARLKGARSASQALDARLREIGDAHLARSARARGGRLVAEGLEVDASLRTAVDVALGDAVAAFLVDSAAAVALSGEASGTLVLRGRASRAGRVAEGERIEAAAMAAGGGRLIDALRQDPGGAVTRLLARTVWVPLPDAAIALHIDLPPGWRVVSRNGALVGDDGVVRLGHGARTSSLALHDERRSLATKLTQMEADLVSVEAALESAQNATVERRAALDAARASLDSSRRDRRAAEERASTAGRSAEAATREDGWQVAQMARAAAELADARDALSSLTPPVPPRGVTDSAALPPATAQESQAAVLASRVSSLRERREELAARQTSAEREQDAWLDRRRRAEVGLAMDEARTAQLDEESVGLVVAAVEMRRIAERTADRLVDAVAEEGRLASTLDSVLRGSGEDRTLLHHAERQATDARERLRGAEARSRAAEVAEMQARIGFDATREQFLVELAGIGRDGLEALDDAAGRVRGEDDDDPEGMTAALEMALDGALAIWAAASPTEGAVEQAPSTGRLVSLRRRYHELGASNPFAALEYAEVRGRLEILEAQRGDLEKAIDGTRGIIADLDRLIADRFRSTFEALEGAFARRFNQLFDGGEAQLSLTDPGDLSATGVEIIARPPGKKRQPLAMLSGGERALTAVALLMAMLEVRPVPFCVLDEVDAALDEANIGRFSQALRGLAEGIQFIVITHNRGTIEAADALYGVTVDDDAISRVISLRLEDVIDAHGFAAAGSST